MPNRLKQYDQQVDRIDEDESQEVLVIAIPEAVVDEWAVVVEQLHASVADRAVERGLALDYFTARAKVIQMQSNLQSHFNKFGEIVVRSQVARLQKHRQNKQWHADDKQADRSVNQRCMGALQKNIRHAMVLFVETDIVDQNCSQIEANAEDEREGRSLNFLNRTARHETHAWPLVGQN